MRVAALDFGTNTFLCLIAEAERGKILSVLSDQQEIVRLGQGLSSTKRIHPDALVRAQAALGSFSKIIKEFKVDRVLAVATAAARDAENAGEFKSLCDELQIPVQIISGDLEAKLTFQGALFGQENHLQSVVIDVGGGSTEYIYGNQQGLEWATSLKFGCVTATERFLTQEPAQDGEFLNLKNFISSQICEGLKEIASRPFDQIVAVAGTPTTLAAIELGGFIEDKVQGFTLTSAHLERWITNLKKLTTAEKTAQYNIPASRADVLLAGATILYESLKFFKNDRMIVSTKGVRYGLAMEMAGEKI